MILRAWEAKGLERCERAAPVCDTEQAAGKAGLQSGREIVLVGMTVCPFKKLSLKRTCNLCSVTEPVRVRTGTETQT